MSDDLIPRADGRLDLPILHAFCDGELEPEDAARVVMHLADCPADQKVVDGIMAMNAMLARACAGPMEEPVPQGLRAAIFGGPVAVPGNRDNEKPGQGSNMPGLRRTLRWAGGGAALAAGLAALAIWFPWRDDPMLPLGAVDPRSPMAEALGEIPSGDTRLVARNLELNMVASFAVENGYCREFTLRPDDRPDLHALACTGPESWQVVAREEVSDAPPAEGYIPAEGGQEDLIGTQLDRLGAGAVLSQTEEAEALSAGWR
ncbi:MAG: anti-sigma factor family protein [Pseudorhodobacter sp.]